VHRGDVEAANDLGGVHLSAPERRPIRSQRGEVQRLELCSVQTEQRCCGLVTHPGIRAEREQANLQATEPRVGRPEDNDDVSLDEAELVASNRCLLSLPRHAALTQLGDRRGTVLSCCHAEHLLDGLHISPGRHKQPKAETEILHVG